MKAAIRGPDGLLLADVPQPECAAEEVLVRVRAAALNRADLGILAGRMHGPVGGTGTVLGLEWAGEVVAAGGSVAGLQPGDRVMGSGKGAFAEYAVADHGRVMKLPRADLGFDAAATLPVALQTMHDALVTNGGMRRGDAVLIQGASSGVGLMGMRVARALGARLVIGTSTDAGRRARLAEFGADFALDSSDPGWVEQALAATQGRGVDVAVDQLSGAAMNQTLAATRIGGAIVNVGRLAGMRADFDFDLHALRRIRYVGVTFRTRSVQEVRDINTRMRADLDEHLAAGRLALPIDRVYPFEAIGEAFARMAANAHFGKIVVTMA